MTQSPFDRGTFRLFRLFGIDVSLHWTWLLVAVYEFQQRAGIYEQPIWAAAEYLMLFLIVLIHEFGHALACRSVGGVAERILLWPFGGVAFVNPPQRPGAFLWSIAAGPLVNVLLLPGSFWLLRHAQPAWGDAYFFCRAIAYLNIGLLIFNLLPIYPLDGGQILRSLLWFVLGRARSLMVAAAIGIAGAGGVLFLAIWHRSVWLGILAGLGAMQCWAGIQHARRLHRVLSGPRYQGASCPSCGAAPPVGPYWVCICGQSFDPFASGAICPFCGMQHQTTTCPDCGHHSPILAWCAAPVL